MEKISVDSGPALSKGTVQSINLPNYLSTVVTPSMINNALKKRLPASQRFDREMSLQKQHAFELTVLDEKCTKSRESLKKSSQKALRSAKPSTEDAKVPAYKKCICAFCGKHQTFTPDSPTENNDISAKDEKDRSYLFSEFMKPPVDPDFIFIINR